MAVVTLSLLCAVAVWARGRAPAQHCESRSLVHVVVVCGVATLIVGVTSIVDAVRDVGVGESVLRTAPVFVIGAMHVVVYARLTAARLWRALFGDAAYEANLVAAHAAYAHCAERLGKIERRRSLLSDFLAYCNHAPRAIGHRQPPSTLVRAYDAVVAWQRTQEEVSRHENPPAQFVVRLRRALHELIAAYFDEGAETWVGTGSTLVEPVSSAALLNVQDPMLAEPLRRAVLELLDAQCGDRYGAQLSDLEHDGEIGGDALQMALMDGARDACQHATSAGGDADADGFVRTPNAVRLAERLTMRTDAAARAVYG